MHPCSNTGLARSRSWVRRSTLVVFIASGPRGPSMESRFCRHPSPTVLALLKRPIARQKRLPRDAPLAKELVREGRDQPFVHNCVEYRVGHLLLGIENEQRIRALPT